MAGRPKRLLDSHHGIAARSREAPIQRNLREDEPPPSADPLALNPRLITAAIEAQRPEVVVTKQPDWRAAADIWRVPSSNSRVGGASVVERRPEEPRVAGSIPALDTMLPAGSPSPAPALAFDIPAPPAAKLTASSSWRSILPSVATSEPAAPRQTPQGSRDATDPRPELRR